ncbi:MAG: alpha-ketoglutarate-dependent dioxygenase AlkB [Rhodobiaceae bacterium]|nr:alpha-ketoglutarate-dependent dioxygenase AlkB [Rhodobiaceae bacterium]
MRDKVQPLTPGKSASSPVRERVSAFEPVPGTCIWSTLLPRATQAALVEQLRGLVEKAPFYRVVMPRTGKPLSVTMTNLGDLGWISDKTGYRYEAHHPNTGSSWPAIPDNLLRIWNELTDYSAPPQACLVNYYGEGARMGQHQDRDEEDLDAPVLSISLGDTALFRLGGEVRSDPTLSFKLTSGDVMLLEGPSRLRFHGVDRTYPGSSTLLEKGGRLNLTLRRVTRPGA